MFIPRHNIDRETIQRRFDTIPAHLKNLAGSVGRTPNNLTLVAPNALDIVSCGSVVAPDSPYIHPALCIASRCLSALFAVASAERLPVEVVVMNGQTIRYETRPDNSLIHPIRWLQGFYVAALCRDYDSLQALHETPLELLRASSTRCPQYTYLFVDAIRGFIDDAPDTAQRLLKTMEATDPDRADIHNPDWALNIDVPIIELFFRFAIGDDSGFAVAVSKAVAGHANYWTKSRDKDKSRHADSFLALGPLGLSALAYDRKMPIAVESDYFPLKLVQEVLPFSTHLP